MNYQMVMALSDLPVQRATKVTVADTALILIRDGEQVRAFQAKCPHAGAPLEQGAVCDRRLICPWHKANFDIQNGALLEPLALSDLQQYPVQIIDGMVQVSTTAMPATAPANSEAGSPVFVILGAGAAGAAAAWTLRREGFNGELVVIEREKEAPYDRTTLTKFVPSGDMPLDKVPPLLDKQFWQHVRRLPAEVERLDSVQQQLHFADGSTLYYDKLLLASGGVPQRPAIPGKALFGVHVLRSIEQTETLLKEVHNLQSLVIVGNNFIGMEMASALRKKSVDVQVIGRHPLPFFHLFGGEIAQHFRQIHEENGVRFIDGDVVGLEGEKHVTGVRLMSGGFVAAPVVLLATGIAPATEFVCDLRRQDDATLQTDEYLQVAPNVWAAGDIAAFPGRQGVMHIEHYRVAHQLGQVAALNMLGKQKRFDRVPFFWTTQFGVRYEYLGHASDWDEYRRLGSLEEKKFIALYGKGGKLLAASSCGMYRLTAALLHRMQRPMTMQQAEEWINEQLAQG